MLVAVISPEAAKPEGSDKRWEAVEVSLQMNVPQVQDSRDEASDVPTLWGSSSTGRVLSDEDLLPDQLEGSKHLKVAPETEGLFISLGCELKFRTFVETCVYSGLSSSLDKRVAQTSTGSDQQ